MPIKITEAQFKDDVKPHIRNGHNVRGYWRNKRNV